MQTNRRAKLVRQVAEAMHRTGILWAGRHLSRHFELARRSGRILEPVTVRGAKFAILCYHRVGSGGIPFHSGFEREAFEKQICFLKKAYRIVPLDDVCRGLESGDSRQAVALTFDDGYRDVYTHAFPVLRKYGVPATVYLTASAVEAGDVSWYDRIFAIAMLCPDNQLVLEGNPRRIFKLSGSGSRLQAATEIVKILRGYSNRDRLAACAELGNRMELPASAVKERMLTWGQVREMQENGITFGAHTMSHPVVGRLANGEHSHELLDSKRLLEERLQRPVEHFAYPFGTISDLDTASCALLPQYGYRSAVSTVWGVNTQQTNLYLLKRIGGEEPCLALFALRLAWAFMREATQVPEMNELERAVQSGMRLGSAQWQHTAMAEAEAKHA